MSNTNNDYFFDKEAKEAIEESKKYIEFFEEKVQERVADGELRSFIVLDGVEHEEHELQNTLDRVLAGFYFRCTDKYGQDFFHTLDGRQLSSKFVSAFFKKLNLPGYAKYIDNGFGGASVVRNGFSLDIINELLRMEKEQNEKDFLETYSKLNGLTAKKTFLREMKINGYAARKKLRRTLFPSVSLCELVYGDSTRSFINAIKDLSDEDKLIFCYLISLEAAAYVEENSEECQEILGNNDIRDYCGHITDKEVENNLWKGFLSCHIANKISKKSGIKDEFIPEQTFSEYNGTYSYSTNLSILLWKYLRGDEGVFTQIFVGYRSVPIFAKDFFTYEYWQYLQPAAAYDLMVAREELAKDGGHPLAKKSDTSTSQDKD